MSTTASTNNPSNITHPSNANIHSICVGNDTSILVHGPTPNHNLHLHNILYTPHIIKNLIFIRQFTKDNKVFVEFDPNGFSIKDLKTGETIFRNNSAGDLYPISTPSVFVTCSSSNTWHNRLGHPGFPVMDHFRRRSWISCNKFHQNNLCHSCQISKHKCLPFFILLLLL